MPKQSHRENLLEAGRKVMFERGYRGAGVRDIVSEAGAPQGSFTNHFRSKEAFAGEVLDRYFDYLREIVEATLGDRSLSPRDRIRRYFDVITGKLKAEKWALGCLIGNLSLEISPESRLLRTRLSQIFAEWREPFAAYLVEAFCDITLTLLLYLLLRPVREDLALLATLFRVVSTATFAVTELFYFAAALPLRGADYLKTFSPDQLNTLALLSLKAYSLGAGIFMMFYGTASIILGYLMIRSGFLPWILGALLALSGLGFVVYNFLLVLAPRYAWSALQAPAGVTALALGLWLLVKGVDVTKWLETNAAGARP